MHCNIAIHLNVKIPVQPESWTDVKSVPFEFRFLWCQQRPTVTGIVPRLDLSCRKEMLIALSNYLPLWATATRISYVLAA